MTAVDLGAVMDAAYAIGQRLRMNETPHDVDPLRTFRLEWVRGSQSAEYVEIVVDEAVLRYPKAVDDIWDRLGRRLLGDELMRDITRARQRLTDSTASRAATVVLVGGYSDGQVLDVRTDAQGWPPELWRVPVPSSNTSFMMLVDAPLFAPQPIDNYEREVMNPETGVWRYRIRAALRDGTQEGTGA